MEETGTPDCACPYDIVPLRPVTDAEIEALPILDLSAFYAANDDKEQP